MKHVPVNLFKEHVVSSMCIEILLNFLLCPFQLKCSIGRWYVMCVSGCVAFYFMDQLLVLQPLT